MLHIYDMIMGKCSSKYETSKDPISQTCHSNRNIALINCNQLKGSLFVCVEVLWPSQHTGVMLSMVSLPNHMFTGQA